MEMDDDEVAELLASREAADLDFSMTRMQRDGLLNKSDWTQVADSPLTDEKKAEWATYREKLRDLPATSNAGSGGKVSEVVWPSEPS